MNETATLLMTYSYPLLCLVGKGARGSPAWKGVSVIVLPHSGRPVAHQGQRGGGEDRASASSWRGPEKGGLCWAWSGEG